MNNIFLRKIVPFLLIPFLLIISGCGADEALDNNVKEVKEADVVLNLSGTVMRAGRKLFSGDTQIKSLRVMIFKGMALDVQKYYEEGNLSATISLQAHVGQNSKVVVIANETPDMTTVLNKTIFFDDFKKIQLPERKNNQELIPVMVGIQENISIAEGRKNSVEVKLVRTVAKITLEINQKTAENDDIKIQSIEIIRNAKNSTLADLKKSVDKNTLWNWSFDSMSVSLINHGKSQQIISDKDALYVYENLSNSASDTIGRAPILFVKALYNGISTTYKTYINAEGGNNKYQILRNHHYHLKGTITQIGEYNGLLLTTSVQPWDKENLQHDFLKPYLVHLDPAELTDGHSHTIKYGQPVTFHVRIKASEGTMWKATLSDGLNFGFDTHSSYVSEGKADGTDYIVSVMAKSEGGNKPRNAEIYFTVNGKVVILNKNSEQKAIIKIVQPAE